MAVDAVPAKNTRIVLFRRKVITVFHRLAGNNVCIVAISHCIVGTHSHLVVTVWVQVGQVSMWSLHI